MNIRAITKDQIIIIQTTINKDANLKAAKEDIVKEVSNGRTASVKELLFAEADSLIKGLKKESTFKKELDKADPCHKMRGKILSRAHELGWHKKDAKGNVVRDRATQKAKIDFDRVNEWCVKYGYLSKKLDKYTYAELPKLVTQFEKVLNNYLKSF